MKIVNNLKINKDEIRRYITLAMQVQNEENFWGNMATEEILCEEILTDDERRYIKEISRNLSVTCLDNLSDYYNKLDSKIDKMIASLM